MKRFGGDRLIQSLVKNKEINMAPITQSTSEMECLNMIASDLVRIGFSASTKGFTYICHTIFFAVQDSKNLTSVNSKIFPKIAALYGTKTSNVERVCRHALDAVYFEGGLKNINRLLGFEYLKPYEKPSLSNFISTLSEHNIIKLSRRSRSNSQKSEKRKKSLILKINKLFNPATKKRMTIKTKRSTCRDISL